MTEDNKVYKRVIVVNSSHGDWSGIYLDYELWRESHSISQYDWSELINNHYLDSVVISEVDGEWLEYCGNLPQSYTEIPMDKFV